MAQRQPLLELRDEDGPHLVELPHRAPLTMPRHYTVQHPGGPQQDQPEAVLLPFPLMPDMSTRLEGDFQRVVVDALTAIWARVSRCHCSSTRSVRASSPSAGGVCEPAHCQQEECASQLTVSSRTITPAQGKLRGDHRRDY